MEKDDRDEVWIEDRIRIIEETQATLDLLNKMPTCGV